MAKKITLTHVCLLIIALLIVHTDSYGQSENSAGKNKINPELNIPDEKFRDLDGAYSIITVKEGKTTELNIKFDKGRITNLLINGQEIPENKWGEFEGLISDYIEYIGEEEEKDYRYKDWYEFEYDLRQDLKDMNDQIKELEISKRLKRFYDNEMREWVEDLEMEINESEAIKEIDRLFDDFMHDLEKFVAERKAYFREIEKDKER